jgi:hypothetical protein
VRHGIVETCRRKFCVDIHKDIWEIKKWISQPTKPHREDVLAVTVQLHIGTCRDVALGDGVGPWVSVEFTVAAYLLELSGHHRAATRIQQRYRGFLTRKWHGIMEAMLMLPGQGGIEAAVEKYGFRMIKLLEELQRRVVKLGPHHVGTADITYNIGRLYQQHGDTEMALKAFYRALTVYKTELGDRDLKTANLIYCLALIYKDRADAGMQAEAERMFVKVDTENTGFVTLAQLEPALQELFADVDLSICNGPQTIVALLLQVFEAEETDGSGTLDPEEFHSVFHGCLLLVAKGYFDAAAVAFAEHHGEDYEFAINARHSAELCAKGEDEEDDERESEEVDGRLGSRTSNTEAG